MTRVMHVVNVWMLGICCRKRSMTLLKIFPYYRYVTDFLHLPTTVNGIYTHTSSMLLWCQLNDKKASQGMSACKCLRFLYVFCQVIASMSCIWRTPDTGWVNYSCEVICAQGFAKKAPLASVSQIRCQILCRIFQWCVCNTTRSLVMSMLHIYC